MKNDFAKFTTEYLDWIHSHLTEDFPTVRVHNFVDLSFLLTKLTEIHPIGDNVLLGVPCDYGWTYGAYMLYFLPIADRGDQPSPCYLPQYGEQTEKDEQKDFMKHFTLSHIPMAYWQLCLLIDSWRFLPLWQHACYSTIHYIMTPKDLEMVENRDPKVGKKVRSLRFDVTPRVVLDDAGAEVTYYVWSEWGGLIQSTKRFENKNGFVKEIDWKKKTLIKFDCGILF